MLAIIKVGTLLHSQRLEGLECSVMREREKIPQCVSVFSHSACTLCTVLVTKQAAMHSMYWIVILCRL